MDNKSQTREYFDKVAQGYLDRYYAAGTGRYPNLQLREDIIVQVLTDLVNPGSAVLDIGCGSGSLLAELAGKGYQMSGLDLAPSMVEVTRALVASLPADKGMRCEVLQGDIERLPYAAASFDAAVASGVFEYLTSDAPGLRETRRVLRDGGIAIVSFRNRTFNAYSANPYTLAEHEAGDLGWLLKSAVSDIREDSTRIKDRVESFYQELRRVSPGLLRQQAPNGNGSGENPVDFAHHEDEGWQKTMARRQHSVSEVKSAAAGTGFILERVSYFHFHPFPPVFEGLMPELCHLLGLSLERFRDTQLGALLASGFVAVLRATGMS